MQANKTWRVVREVDGAALEMLCSPSREPRVQIPNSPPLGNNTNVEDNSTFVFFMQICCGLRKLYSICAHVGFFVEIFAEIC